MAPQSAEARIIITSKDLSEKGIQSANKNLQQLGKTVAGVGKKMSLFVTGPLAALGTLAVKTASDYEETRSKFQTVFGDFAAQAEEWAVNFGRAVGRSQNDILGWLSTIQDTFVPLGFAREQSAEFSKVVTQLAVDLASFNNVAEDKALADLQTTLVGNVEAARKYGVIINQTVLDQQLLNMGIEGGVAAASEQEKVLARLQILIASTGDAQGDAARTAQSFANQMRALRSDLKDVLTILGQIMLPVLSKIIARVRSAIEFFKNMDERFQRLIVIAGALVAAIGPLLVLIGSFITIAPAIGAAFTAMLGPIGLVIAAVAALGVGIFFLVKHWDEVSRFMVDTWVFLKDKALMIFNLIKAVVLDHVRVVLEGLIAVREVFPGTADKLRSAVDGINATIDESVGKFQEYNETTWESVRAQSELEQMQQKNNELAKKGTEIAEQATAGTQTQNEELQNLIDSILAENEAQRTANEQALTHQEIMEGFTLEPAIQQTEAYTGQVSSLAAGLSDVVTMQDIWNQQLEDAQISAADLADIIGTTMVDAFVGFADAVSGAGDSILGVVKGAFAAILRAIGQQLLALAAFYALTLRFGKAALAFAAGTAAIVASNLLKGLQQGGEITDGSPLFGDRQVVALERGEQVIDKFTAERNRTEIDQMRMGSGSAAQPVVFMLDGEVLGRWILKSSRNKQTKVFQGAIVS